MFSVLVIMVYYGDGILERGRPANVRRDLLAERSRVPEHFKGVTIYFDLVLKPVNR